MPAEAVHLSALTDSLAASARLARALAAPEHLAAARLGAVFVDLPYFDRFALGVARYALGLPPRPSRLGDVLHNQAPIALGRALCDRAARLARDEGTHREGAWLRAFALGYASHAAVDTAMHPLVNALARARAGRLGDALHRQHQEVEKLQSVVFHEERMGFDFMGRPAVREHIAVDAGSLAGRTLDALRDAASEALSVDLSPALLARWSRGYRQYSALLASRLGGTLAPSHERARERHELYDAVGFAAEFSRAVARSVAWMELALDDALASLPETSLDWP